MNLKMKPARFHGGNGRNFHIAFFKAFKSKPRQKVHPAFRLELQITKVREAWYNPGIVRHEDVKAGIAFCKHHLAHLFGAFMQWEKSIVLAGIKPLADTFVKTNKEITKFIERRDINRGARASPKARKLATFTNALRRFHATPDRARKVHRIANRRNHFPKRYRLAAPRIRKPHTRTKVLVVGRDVIAFGMA